MYRVSCLTSGTRTSANASQLLQFREGSESSDAYLLRFKSIAQLNGSTWGTVPWEAAGGNLQFVAYSRSGGLQQFKTIVALLKRYELSEEVFQIPSGEARQSSAICQALAQLLSEVCWTSESSE